MKELIPHSRPWITEADIASVSTVLASSMLGQGQQVRMLEQRIAAWLNAEDGVAVASGSAGLVLALYGLGVGVGDEVIVPTYVCRSVLEAVLTVGAQPVLCDVGTEWVITPSNVSHLLTSSTRAIVVPHMYGIFADVGSFRRLGVPIIEDFAQALDDRAQRSSLGDVAVLSFHPTKCLTAGEGGMVLSSNLEITRRMRILRDGDGDSYSARMFAPMSDVAAALAHAQLDRYQESLLRRREIAGRYLKTVRQICPSALNMDAFARSMFFRFPLRLAGGLVACQDAFYSLGVCVRRGVDELLHRRLGFSDSEFPEAVAHYATTVSLPIYPALTRHQESRCLDAIMSVFPRLMQSTEESR